MTNQVAYVNYSLTRQSDIQCVYDVCLVSVIELVYMHAALYPNM